MSFIITLINSLFNLLGSAASTLLMVLPDSPFQWNLAGTSPLLTWLFWLVPIPGILTLLSAYVTAVASYYLIRVALRWIKVVGS
jgi:hypothetical protein